MPAWLDRRFSMYRPDEGGFAVDASSPRADIDATQSAIFFLRQVGAIPGTWERELLRGPALAAGPTKAPPVLLRPGDDAGALPSLPTVNSVRVYRDSVPPEESWNDSTLLQVCYPADTSVPDIMELRQRLSRFLAADGGEYGNWSSKAALRDAPLALDREIRHLLVAREWPDLVGIASDNPTAARFVVVGLDAFQVPVFEVEIRRPGR
jgi:hypothetical protein